MAQTCLPVLVFAALALSASAGLSGTTYTFCGCSISVINDALQANCPGGSTAPGTCSNALLYDEGCKLMCTADLSTPVGKATSLYAKVGVTSKGYEFIGCNNNKLVNSSGSIISFTQATCHMNTPTNLCPEVAFESSCPSGYNCGNFLTRWNNDLGTDQLGCTEGNLAIRDANGVWKYNQKPYCSNIQTWSNFSYLASNANFYQYAAPITASCVASTTVVQCTYPTAQVTSSIASSFFLANRVDSTKLKFKNNSLFTGMSVSCDDGYQLAAFSASNPTSADLSFSYTATLNCATGASWVNSLTGSFPSDGLPTCVVPLAYCNCSYNSFTEEDEHGCRSDILRPIVGPYGCQLGCPPKYRMISSNGQGPKKRLKKFHCENPSSWKGETCLMDEEFSLSAGPYASCEVDLLWGCPGELKTFHCEHCEMAYLKWDIDTSSLTCTQGVLIGMTSVEYSFSALKWFWKVKHHGGAWHGVDFYKGWKSTVGVPIFACWTGDYEPSPIVHCNGTDTSCEKCGFSYFKHNEPDEVCVDGTLTLSYSSSSGTICQNTTIEAELTISCTDGEWTLDGEIIDMDIPIERCEGDIMEATTVAVEETTTEGAVEFTCPEEECSGCSWWGFESDPCHQTCMSAVLQLDFGVDFHLCSASGELDFNLNALFCKNGSWFYLSAEGEISVDLGSTPLISCEPPAPEHHECEQSGCEGCSWMSFPGFGPNQVCYDGVLTLDFGFFSGTCMGGAELDINVNAIFCEGGEWSYLSANGSVSLELTGPLETCLPPPCDHIEPEEPECSACSYREWHGCGSRHKCHDGELEVSFEHHHHICVGHTVINVDALYCDAGNWWYKFGWGRFNFDLFEYNFFQPCYPGPPIHFDCQHSECDSACGFWGFPWWAPRQACSSGVLKIDFEFSEVCVFDLDIHVEAVYCKAGRWYSDVELSVEFTLGENPVDVCVLDMSTVAPEVTTEAVEATTEESCTEPVDACPCEDDGGVVPVSKECVDNNWSYSCGVEGDIFVWWGGKYHRYKHASWFANHGWFAFDCFGRVRFIEGTIRFRCRHDGEASHESGSHESGEMLA